MLETDIVLRRSANHPVDDTSVAGGSVTTTLIDTSSVGEFVPKLKGLASGVLDVNIETQYQVAYLVNVNTTEAATGLQFGLANYVNTHSSGNVQAQSTSALDGTGKFLRIWGMHTATGLLASEDRTLNGLSVVATVGSFSQIYRAELRDVGSGLPVNAAGVISLMISSSVFGRLPVGLDVATREFSFAAAAAAGNVGTFANRRTQPAGLTWSYPSFVSYVNGVLTGSMLALPGTLNPNGGQVAIYCRQIAQPAMGTFDIRLEHKTYFEVV